MAGEKVVVLTEEQGQYLKEFLTSEFRDRRRKSRPKVVEELPHNNVIIALIPDEGIDGVLDGVVSSAECSIFFINGILDEANTLTEQPFTEKIYNLSSCPLPGGQYVPVMLERSGNWVASGTAVDVCVSGTSTSTSSFLDTGTSTLEAGTSTTTTGTGNGGGTTGTGNGTPGTSTSTNCTPITITEQDTRCENGSLNIYSRAVSLNVEAGCLTKQVGTWTYSHSAGSCASGGGLIIINITNITEITNIIENTFYFNSYDFTLNIYIDGDWYVYCVCDRHAGTGTGTHVMKYWCVEAPASTPVGTDAELITGCQFCVEGISEHLYLQFNSGCTTAVPVQDLVFNGTGTNGPGWYTAIDEVSGLLQYWFVPCSYDSGADTLTLIQVVNDVITSVNTFVVEDCTRPFDTGEFGVVVREPCENGIAIISIFEEPPATTPTDPTPEGKVCVYMSEAEVNAFVALGWTLHGGPYDTPGDCASNCTNGGTGTATGTGDTVSVVCMDGTASYPRNLKLAMFEKIVFGGGSYCPNIIEQEVDLIWDELNQEWRTDCISYSTNGGTTYYNVFRVRPCNSNSKLLFDDGLDPWNVVSLSPFVLNRLGGGDTQIDPDCSGGSSCIMQADFWIYEPGNPQSPPPPPPPGPPSPPP